MYMNVQHSQIFSYLYRMASSQKAHQKNVDKFSCPCPIHNVYYFKQIIKVKNLSGVACKHLKVGRIFVAECTILLPVHFTSRIIPYKQVKLTTTYITISPRAKL